MIDDGETITIPKSAIKVIETDAFITNAEMTYSNGCNIIDHVKQDMCRRLAERLLRDVTFEVTPAFSFDNTRFRVRLRLLTD